MHTHMTVKRAVFVILPALLISLVISPHLHSYYFWIVVLLYTLVFSVLILFVLHPFVRNRATCVGKVLATIFSVVVVIALATTASSVGKDIYYSMTGCVTSNSPASYNFNLLTMRCEYFPGRMCDRPRPWYLFFYCEPPPGQEHLRRGGSGVAVPEGAR